MWLRARSRRPGPPCFHPSLGRPCRQWTSVFNDLSLLLSNNQSGWPSGSGLLDGRRVQRSGTAGAGGQPCSPRGSPSLLSPVCAIPAGSGCGWVQDSRWLVHEAAGAGRPAQRGGRSGAPQPPWILYTYCTDARLIVLVPQHLHVLRMVCGHVRPVGQACRRGGSGARCLKGSAAHARARRTRTKPATQA